MPTLTQPVRLARTLTPFFVLSIALWINGLVRADNHVHDGAAHDVNHIAGEAEPSGNTHGHGSDHSLDHDGEAKPAHSSEVHENDSPWHRFQHWLIEALGGEHPHEDAHDHAADAPEILTATHWTRNFELFLEWTPLVAGEPSELLLFLTRLGDFSPVHGGEVVASLTPRDQEQIAHRQETAVTAMLTAPSRPGVYRVRLTPVVVGRNKLALTWKDGADAASFSLEVTVAQRHESEAGQHLEHEHHQVHAETSGQAAAGDSVQLTKEQQWLSDFATAVVARRALSGSIAATGVLRASADGDAHVTAPIDAHLRPAEGGFPYTGMRIEPGQILAYLVPRLAGEADVAGLELAVTRAATELDLARRERERLDALWEDRSIPFREVLQARGDEEVATAELTAASRRLAQVRRTEEGESAGVPVRAPIGGVIARVEVAPGAFVEEGARLFHLVSPERLWLEARIAEADLGRIQTPTGAWFSVRGLGNTPHDGGVEVFALTPETGARLVAYGAMVDPESRTVPVIFEFAPAAYPHGERLRVGQSVTARVYTGEQSETLVVPAGALVNDAGADVVYVQVAGDRFERRLVHTGLRDGDVVGVLNGVREGERIVSRGAYLVHLAAGAAGDAGHHHGHEH